MQNSPIPKQPAAQRLVQLDILRGIAILLVLFRHPIVYYQFKYVGLWWHVSYRTVLFGWTGVDLFFVLSGFLIGGLLFQEIRKTGSLDVKRFLIRRGFKIWPPYFVLVGYAFIALIIKGHHSLHRAFLEILPNLLHLQNYLGSPRDFTWSLSVEEHFYLALPIVLIGLIWLVRKRAWSMNAIPILFILAIIGGASFRILYNWNRPYYLNGDLTRPQFLSHGAYTHLRIDGLLFGVLLAYVHHFHPAALSRIARHRWPLIFAGMALLSPMFFLDFSNHFCWTFGFTMLYLGYGAILIALVYTKPGEGVLGSIISLAPMRGIAWVGFFSYSIYLWQEDLSRTPIQYYLLHRLTWLPAVLYWPTLEAIHLLFAICAGAVMAKLIEIPSLALRDRLFPARTPKIEQHPANVPADLPALQPVGDIDTSPAGRCG